jgi:hypothetical protein
MKVCGLSTGLVLTLFGDQIFEGNDSLTSSETITNPNPEAGVSRFVQIGVKVFRCELMVSLRYFRN